MSILIAIATSNHVALCADCQHTNIRTGLPQDTDLRKIEVISDMLCIAHCGNVFMTEMCMKVVRKLYQDGTIYDSSVTGAVDVIKQAYTTLIEKYPDVENTCTSKFVVSGRLDNGHLGFVIVENSEGDIVEQTVDGIINPTTKIFPPADVPAEYCVNVVDNLTKKHSAKKYSVPVLIEKVFRDTVNTISKKSQYVSAESQFYIYSS